VPVMPTMLCLAMVLGCFLSFFLKVMLNENFKFRYTPLNGSIIAYILIYFIYAFISNKPISSLQIALLVASFILFYFIIINSITTKKQLDVMIAIFTIIGIVISAYGIYQYLFMGTYASSSFVDKELFENITTRVSGTFDNPNVMGEYLLLVIPVALTYFFNFKSFRAKFLSLCVVGFIGISLALTYSRGCYLGIIATIGIFLLLLNIRFILLFIAGILAIPFIIPQSILNRFTSIGNTEDTSTSYRISIWQGAINMIKDYWYRPIGQGKAAFNNIYPIYSLNGVGAEHTHNLFLQIMVETGFLGIISFFSILFNYIRYMFNGLKNPIENKYRIYIIAFSSGLFGFLIQSLFDNTWYNNRIILIFWIFISLGSLARYYSNLKIKKTSASR